MSSQEDLYLSWEFQNNLGYIGGVDIDTLGKEVVIWVEDSYYTFEIPFDKFLEIAKKVKEAEKENMDNVTKYARQYRYAKTEKGKQKKREANKRYYLRKKEKTKNEQSGG